MRCTSLLAALAGLQACTDFSQAGCATRARSHGFCTSSWGREHCCDTCANHPIAGLARTTSCSVPRTRCATWSCNGGKDQAIGATCHVTAKQSEQCARCSVVDSETCAPFVAASKVCQADGSWSGAEPACRRFCDESYVPPDPPLPERVPADTVERFAREAREAQPFTVVPIDAPPFGDYLASKGLPKYMQHRVDVFGQWLVMFTDKCRKRYGTSPSLHVANMYAQWLDWKGTGAPNNAAVWAQLRAYNATMVMFETDGSALNKFFDKYPFDEVPPSESRARNLLIPPER
jgi:hypothetical protein